MLSFKNIVVLIYKNQLFQSCCTACSEMPQKLFFMEKKEQEPGVWIWCPIDVKLAAGENSAKKDLYIDRRICPIDVELLKFFAIL